MRSLTSRKRWQVKRAAIDEQIALLDKAAILLERRRRAVNSVLLPRRTSNFGLLYYVRGGAEIEERLRTLNAVRRELKTRWQEATPYGWLRARVLENPVYIWVWWRCRHIRDNWQGVYDGKAT